MLNPLIGIIASSGGAAAAASSYESIATTTLGSNNSTITFSSIPSTYTHLQIRGSYRADSSVAILMQFNSDTASNYACHALYGNGATAAANGAASRANIPIERNGAMPTGTSMFGGCVIDILDYTSTAKYKTVRSLSGHDENGSGYINFESGLWMNSASAISSISIIAQPSGSFTTYTKFALYGIKGA